MRELRPARSFAAEQQANDHRRKTDEAPYWLTDTRSTEEIERDIRALCRHTVHMARPDTRWRLGHDWQNHVGHARIRHSQSIARSAATWN